jgi:anti-sigma factor RsiW
MTHPDQLLADYVQGTLAERERALLHEHLSTCAVCREELELAQNAVSALAILEERPVPLGVTGPVLAEAERRVERRRTVVWQRFQWGAGIAAAAALVLIVALNVGGNGADPAIRAEGEGAGMAASDAAAEPEQFDVIEKLDRNYAEADVREFAEQAARTARVGNNGEEAAPQAGDALGGGSAAGATMAAGAAVDQVTAAPAIDCLRSAEVPLDDPGDRLLSIIEARFAGTPAYFAALLDSPSEGQPADTVNVWVVDRRDCQILSFVTKPI